MNFPVLNSRGIGDRNKAGAGSVGKCVCPKCGYRMENTQGKKCMSTACPKCGARMVRE